MAYYFVVNNSRKGFDKYAKKVLINSIEDIIDLKTETNDIEFKKSYKN